MTSIVVERTKQQKESNTTAILEHPEKSNQLKSSLVQPPKKIVLKKENKVTSGLSLSSLKAKKAHQIKKNKVLIADENLPEEDFTQEALTETWNRFIKIIQDKGQFNLASILSIDLPKLVNTTINLEFPNATNKVEVEREQHELLSFLRKSLNNYTINLNIIVNEEMEKKYAYTAQEKFEKLKEKNPNIDILRKTFDLDI